MNISRGESPNCPSVETEKGKERLSGKMSWQDIPGWFDFEDLYEEIVEQLPEGAKIVEVGCWLGRSAAFLASKVAACDKRVEIYCVDSWRGEGSYLYLEKTREERGDLLPAFRRNLRACGLLDRVETVRGDSAGSADRFADSSLDFVFIDASHDYESVKRDIEAWLPKLKQGGRLCGHDYPLGEVALAVDELLEVRQISQTSWEMIHPRRQGASNAASEENSFAGLWHRVDLDAYFFQGYDEAFAIVCDQRYFRGLWALLNSIYAYHGARHAVFVYGRGLSPEQRRRLSEHPLWIRYRDFSELPKPASGAWEAKQQVLAALFEEVRCLYLLDADLVLVSRVDGVFALASRGRIVASRDGEGIEFGEEYRRYDPELVGRKQDYLNSGNLCLDLRRHWQVAALWGFSAGYGAYSPNVGAPLGLPGHGDQGLLNGIFAMSAADESVTALPEEEWCDNRSTSSLKIEGQSEAGRLRVRNRTTGRRQRLVHSTGPKWWTVEGAAENVARGDKQRCFEHFENLVPLEGIPPEPSARDPRILVGVCSCAGNEARREACRRTWASRRISGIKVVFFAGKEAIEEEDLWRLDVGDGVDSQSLKVQAFMARALDEEEFDYLLKCDDDTYLVLERVLELASATDADLVGDLTLDGPGRHVVGGAGYLVSRRLLERYRHVELPEFRCEDALISWWAREQGFRLSASPLLQAGNEAGPDAGNRMISAHGLSPEQMRRLHDAFEPADHEEWYQGSHPHWEATLKLRRNGHFERDGNWDEGRWKKETDSGELVLHWDDWPTSRLAPVRGGYSDGELQLKRIGASSEANTPRERKGGPRTRKLILKSELSPGDIITLTATVRDLQRSHPERFHVDVRTLFPQLWENNPYLTPLEESDPEVEVIECAYPLINDANRLPYHMIHGFRKFLEDRLEVAIRPQEFRGHLVLSEEEKGWMSQVEEIEGVGTRFWIIASGGKRDYTAKWWDPDRAQAVVDHFEGRIRFVQCGREDDVHSPLKNVINFIGSTDMRQLVRLMYHADGVVCPVTMFMHLAAAVETRPGRPENRPCVVVAGGREPPHWEAYPHHQFLHTMGALPCCQDGGCWKSRVEALGDGAEQDKSLCVQPVELATGIRIPRCLDLIGAEQVIDAIETYLAYEELGTKGRPGEIPSRRKP